jgi:large subunit ribosomal protein L21e
MKGSKGYRRGTRNLRVKPREKGKISIRTALQTFEREDKVSIRINPKYQKLPHPRFNGLIGRVVGVQGRAYYVSVKDGGKDKRVLVTPEHLRRMAQ